MTANSQVGMPLESLELNAMDWKEADPNRNRAKYLEGIDMKGLTEIPDDHIEQGFGLFKAELRRQAVGDIRRRCKSDQIHHRNPLTDRPGMAPHADDRTTGLAGEGVRGVRRHDHVRTQGLCPDIDLTGATAQADSFKKFKKGCVEHAAPQ